MGGAWGAWGEVAGRQPRMGLQAACSHGRQAARTLASVSLRFQLAGLVKSTTAVTWLGLGLGLGLGFGFGFGLGLGLRLRLGLA